MTRVISLLPAATEIVAALGQSDMLVAISHECDYPEHIRTLPRVTTTSIDVNSTSREIDTIVRSLHEAGRPVIALEADQIRELAPDLIITQSLCEVCAVSDGEVYRLTSLLSRTAQVLPLEAGDLGGIWKDIQKTGHALGVPEAAAVLVHELKTRVEQLRSEPAHAVHRVLCLEWLEPPYLAGHWIPELVAAIGAKAVGTQPGAHSVSFSWPELIALESDYVVVMLCGFDISRARVELERLNDPDALRLLHQVPTWIIDGNAYTSRPGPRVVDGAVRIRSALLGKPMIGVERWEPAVVC
jgi:iron complex transport system substrate-binding protein